MKNLSVIILVFSLLFLDACTQDTEVVNKKVTFQEKKGIIKSEVKLLAQAYLRVKKMDSKIFSNPSALYKSPAEMPGSRDIQKYLA